MTKRYDYLFRIMITGDDNIKKMNFIKIFTGADLSASNHLVTIGKLIIVILLFYYL